MYRRMCLCLFLAVTEAPEQLALRNYGTAEELLKKAQCEAEALYIEGGQAKKEGKAVTISAARHNME